MIRELVKRCGESPAEASGDGALARAKLARFVAEVFSASTEAHAAALFDPAVRSDVAAACQALGLSAEIETCLQAMPKTPGALIAECNGLLGHTVRSECPPYELEYERGDVFMQTQSLADIAGCYAAFGVAAEGALAERPDHVAAQWEFLALLAMRECMTTFQRDDDGAGRFCDAERLFLREHAARWMPAFFARIRRADGSAFYRAMAGLADAGLRRWCAELKVDIGPNWLELRVVTDEDSTIECGAPGATTVEIGPRLAAAMADGPHAEPASCS